MPGGIGLPELIIVLVILLVIFGPKRLPGLGRSLGSGMREFKDSITGKTKDEEDEEEVRALEPPAAVSSQQHAADERVTEPRA
ncbi:MAG TPA: twin-arginine translocase TatA/TatE family subunit [Solirubrobacteraceae bacterium]|jgi:sec-independent protein translocase protein TatA